jgi:hypothetical protein
MSFVCQRPKATQPEENILPQDIVIVLLHRGEASRVAHLASAAARFTVSKTRKRGRVPPVSRVPKYISMLLDFDFLHSNTAETSVFRRGVTVLSNGY